MAGVIGLHIDSDRVNVAHLAKRGRRLRLLHFASTKLPLSSSANHDEAVRAALSDIFDRREFLDGDVVASFPSQKCIVEKIELPFKKPREINRTVAFDAESVLPCGAENLCLDWYSLSSGNKKTTVVVVAAKKEALQDYLNLLKSCDVEASAVMPEFCAIYNAARAQGTLKENAGFLLLHTQSETLNLLAMEHSRPSLVHAKNVQTSDASELRKALASLKTTVEANFPVTEFSQVVATGNGVSDSFYEDIGEQLGIPVARAAVPQDIVKDLSPEDARDFGRYGLVAFGLALRGLEGAEITCDLRKGELADPLRYEPLKTPVVAGLTVLVLLFFLLAFHLSAKISQKQAELAVIEKQIEQRWKNSFRQKGPVPGAVAMRMEGHLNKVKALSEGPEGTQRIRSVLDTWENTRQAAGKRRMVIEELALDQTGSAPILRLSVVLYTSDPLAPDKFAEELKAQKWAADVTTSGSRPPEDGKVKRTFTITLRPDDDA